MQIVKVPPVNCPWCHYWWWTEFTRGVYDANRDHRTCPRCQHVFWINIPDSAKETNHAKQT